MTNDRLAAHPRAAGFAICHLGSVICHSDTGRAKISARRGQAILTTYVRAGFEPFRDWSLVGRGPNGGARLPKGQEVSPEKIDAHQSLDTVESINAPSRGPALHHGSALLECSNVSFR